MARIHPPKSLSLTKIVAVVLCLAILACLIALVVKLYGGKSAPTSGGAFDPNTLILPRKAVNGTAILGGEGTETATACLAVGDKRYIAGTTSSHTCDMTSDLLGDNLFLAVLDHELTVQKVVVFGTNGTDKLIAARATNRGLALCADTDAGPKLWFCDYASDTVTEQTLSIGADESAVELYPNRDALYLITAYDGKLAVRPISDSAGEPIEIVQKGTSLACRAVYPTASGLRIFADGTKDGNTYPFVYTVEKKTVSAKLLQLNVGGTRTLDVLPSNGGYRMLLHGGARDLLVTLDSTLSCSLPIELPTFSERGRLTAIDNELAIAYTGADSALFRFDGSAAQPLSYGGGTILDVRPNGVLLFARDGAVSLESATESKACGTCDGIRSAIIGGGDLAVLQAEKGFGGLDLAVLTG